jgi:glycosyltransferase involved in cell wall biosynthesis
MAVAKYLRQHEMDIIHTHSTEAGIVGRWAGFLAGTPVIIHEIHGDPIAESNSRVLNAFVSAAESASAKVTDKFVVKSKRIRNQYLDRGIGSRDQYELIYHGVDLERFGAAHHSDSKSDNLDVLFVGRLAKDKGLWDLLDAIEMLNSVSLRIAGDGPLFGSLKTAVNQRDLPVELLGYRSDIPELMQQSDVLVLPSYREGTPRVITEALASGLPVVSTRIAGIPEQVDEGETGYLIEPGDVDALVNWLDLLSDRELRTEFGEQAQQTVTRFSKETAAQQYRSLYATLLDRNLNHK